MANAGMLNRKTFFKKKKEKKRKTGKGKGKQKKNEHFKKPDS